MNQRPDDERGGRSLAMGIGVGMAIGTALGIAFANRRNDEDG